MDLIRILFSRTAASFGRRATPIDPMRALRGE
jgi:hypothetical protein